MRRRMAADPLAAVGALVRKLGLEASGGQPPPILDAAQTDLPISHPDASLDALVVAGPLERTEDPVAWVSEIRRVLRPGGCVLAIAPDAGRWVWDDPSLRRPFTRKSLRLLFSDHEFSVRSSGYRSIGDAPRPVRAALDLFPGHPRVTWVYALRP
jgi:SAM-dependent methyltransferase